MVKDYHYVVPKRVGNLIVPRKSTQLPAFVFLHCSSEMPSVPSFYTCAFCCVALEFPGIAARVYSLPLLGVSLEGC